MGRKLRHLVVVAIVACVAVPPAGAAVPHSHATSVEKRVLELLNRIRAKRDLPPLRLSGRLVTVSRRHSRDMVRQDYFSHRSRSGSEPRDRIGSAGGRGAIGENIGWGSGIYSAPTKIVEMWMASPGHRAAILDRDFRYAGVGRATGAFMGYGGAAVFTLDFAARMR